MDFWTSGPVVFCFPVLLSLSGKNDTVLYGQCSCLQHSAVHGWSLIQYPPNPVYTKCRVRNKKFRTSYFKMALYIYTYLVISINITRSSFAHTHYSNICLIFLYNIVYLSVVNINSNCIHSKKMYIVQGIR